jgi:hypothetical protein
LLALLRDLTTRKWSQKKMQEQSNLLELARDAIFVRSLDESIQYWNSPSGAQRVEAQTALYFSGRLTSGHRRSGSTHASDRESGD